VTTVNIDLVRRFYDAWNGADPAGQCLAFLSEDFEWVNPSYAVDPGIRRGHDGWRQAVENLASTFEYYRHEPGEMLVNGERVLCLAKFHARGHSGAALDKDEPHVFTLREGKVARLEWFHHTPEAYAAAGMEGPVSASGIFELSPVDRRPLILVFGQTPELSRGTQRELRREYGERGFDTVFADSAESARAVLDGARRTRTELAMMIAAGGASDRERLDLIRGVRAAHPDARTVLTTPYSAIEGALGAMNEGTLDYFFIEPIASVEDQMFPVLTGLLDDWEAWREQAEKAISVVGHEREPASHLVRDFLSRNDIHHRFLEADDSPAQVLLGEAQVRADDLPLVVMGDGQRLCAPGPVELAERLGLRTRAQFREYDLVIVGGGPAGLAAAVYAASEGLHTALIEEYAPGGQAGQSTKIENYLGFPAGVRGGDLAQRALRQARRFGTEIVRLNEAVALEPRDGGCLVTLRDQTRLSCRCALVSCGVAYRRLEADGVEELVGRGIYYGAGPSEAENHKGRQVFIVGGANSAGQAALHLAGYAKRVTMVLRAGSLGRRMSSYLVERIEKCENIDVLTRTMVTAARGDSCLEELTLAHTETGSERTVPADSAFVFIGAVPRTEWLADALERDESGYILTGRDVQRSGREWSLTGLRPPLPLETTIPGVFCAGDVRHGSVKRVASAVGEGAMAVQLINEYLAELAEDGRG
jgi:thioredoxin reductase (NADPH)